MPDPVVYEAYASQGTKIYITPSGGSKTEIGLVTEISEISTDKETIDVTTLGSTGGYREYIGSFKTPGTVDINGFLAEGGAEPGQTALMSAYESDDTSAFEVDFPDGSKVTFDAIVKQKAFGPANVGSAIAFRAQLQISGAITFTAPSSGSGT